jgi:hypothetical protein
MKGLLTRLMVDLPTSIRPVSDKCIYCANPLIPAVDLTGEHIIGVAFGGKWELLKASCLDCAKITSQIEKRVADNIVTPIREHLGLRGRTQKKPRSRATLHTVITQCTVKHKVPVADYPAAIYSLDFDPATSLSHKAFVPFIKSRLVVQEIGSDFSLKANRIPGQINLVQRTPFNPLDLARMLAKIAHSYAVAKLGTDTFRPFLTDLILGRSLAEVAHLVGGISQGDLISQERHHLSHEWVRLRSGRRILVITISLFGDLGLPTYKVVAGQDHNAEAPVPGVPIDLVYRLQLSGRLADDGQIVDPTEENLLDQYSRILRARF